uniref:Synaptogyrin 3 n=1 Tax=Scleropages formosus TaxID=113540 RepID=A0A8C9VA47_SCLFO
MQTCDRAPPPGAMSVLLVLRGTRNHLNTSPQRGLLRTAFMHSQYVPWSCRQHRPPVVRILCSLLVKGSAKSESNEGRAQMSSPGFSPLPHTSRCRMQTGAFLDAFSGKVQQQGLFWDLSPQIQFLYRLSSDPTVLSPSSQIFSMVVFGSIVNEGYVNNGSERLHCIFNKNYDACNYGIAVGVIAFLASIFFFALDVYFPQISSVKDRKRAVLVEIAFSGLWTFLWFVGFCFLANQWQRTSPKELPLAQGADAARAAIAFSFFSIITWVSSGVLVPLGEGFPLAHTRVPCQSSNEPQPAEGNLHFSGSTEIYNCKNTRQLM